MTESEAKTKWCPLTRIARLIHPNAEASHVTTVNRGDFGDARDFCNCIASACMFWRSNGSVNASFQGESRFQETGFCGAAGRPWNY